MKGIIIECDCGSHLLSVNKDDETDWFYLSMYSYGSPQTYGFWKRLKNAWRLLRTGKMFSDQLIINSGEAMRIKDFFMLNSEQEDERSVAGKDASSSEAGIQKNNL